MRAAFLVFAAALAAVVAANDLGRGFGDEVEWMKIDEGLAAAKESNKLAMVVVHKSWCGACKRLGPSFAGEQRVKDLADNFVMINVHDDEEPADAKYKPDGGYIPRIMFFTPDGELLTDYNSGNQKYLYFYGSGSQVAAQMAKAKDHAV